MNTIAIIQARMGATRLPGKVLKKILGRPMLELQLERIKRAKLIDRIVIATTIKPQDDPIVLLTKKLTVAVYRGSEVDVLDRYYQTAKKFSTDVIIRLTGDCPLIDPQIIDQLITTFRDGKYDYVSNVHLRSFPRGMDAEAMSFLSLETAWKKSRSPYNREHVTPYIYSHPRQFRLKDILAPQNLRRPDLRLTVDEPVDLRLVRKIYQSLYPQNPNFSLQDIVDFIDSCPSLANLNSQVRQKTTPHQKLSPLPLRSRLIQPQDIDLVLSWRNDPFTRTMSFNQSQITRAAHRRWFTKTLQDNSKLWLIVETWLSKKWQPIGQVRYDHRSRHISIVIAPEFRNRGLATPLIKTGLRIITRKFSHLPIIALIKPDNIPSTKAFTRAGFKFIRQTTHQGSSCLQYQYAAN